MPPLLRLVVGGVKIALWLFGIIVLVLGILYVVGWFKLRSPPRKKKKARTEPLSICFLHPDLGIGGAEKLVVETAVLLQNNGHKVRIITCRHDKSRCFPPTADGTLHVTVAGNQFPRAIMGRFQILCAIIRFFLASIYLLKENSKTPFDVIFVDQISATIPILLWSQAKVLFYCHFPDQLLTTRTNIIKWLYRLPFDFLEAVTTAAADKVLVNSKFTAQVFKEAFPAITRTPTVLYPAVDPSQYSVQETIGNGRNGIVIPEDEIVLLSVNRFERKKNIALAIKALKVLCDSVSQSVRDRITLYIAGGFDAAVAENQEHLKELKDLAIELGVSKHIRFLTSVPDHLRNMLLRRCVCLLYTPPMEHFGIVPLEAALAERPVIACNSGGPLETIVDGQTGFLRPPDPYQWAEVIRKLIETKGLSAKMGAKARQHALTNFSSKRYIETLDRILRDLVSS